MDDIRQNIANNITRLRANEHHTQAELAEKLNYSDKAVSKWERGESIPDVAVLKRIADLYGVTVDWLIDDNAGKARIAGNRKKRNRKLITLLSLSVLWLIAITLFVAFWIYNREIASLWLIFIAAIPLSAVLLLIFNSIWGKYKVNMYIISFLVWTAIAFTYLLMLNVFSNNFWVLFLIGIPAQVAIIIWHMIERQ